MNIDNIQINSKLIVIVGPTASGKTELSIQLAKKYDAEIVNGDAFQVYRKMDIGTAKITEEEKQSIKHHLFDIVDYDQKFDVAKYQKLARTIIDERLKKDMYTIIVGGSTLYVQAILYDYRFREYSVEFSSAKETFEKYEISELQEYISNFDVSLNNSEIHNHKRLVNIASKLSLGINLESKNEQKPYYNDFQIIGVKNERTVLYDRIDKRVLKMLELGLVEEVRQFKKNYYSQQAIGYKEVHQYLSKELNYEEMISKIQKNSRNFAKRQLTWYNNKMKVMWYYNEGGVWISY